MLSFICPECGEEINFIVHDIGLDNDNSISYGEIDLTVNNTNQNFTRLSFVCSCGNTEHYNFIKELIL